MYCDSADSEGSDEIIVRGDCKDSREGGSGALEGGGDYTGSASAVVVTGASSNDLNTEHDKIYRDSYTEIQTIPQHQY